MSLTGCLPKFDPQIHKIRDPRLTRPSFLCPLASHLRTVCVRNAFKIRERESDVIKFACSRLPSVKLKKPPHFMLATNSRDQDINLGTDQSMHTKRTNFCMKATLACPRQASPYFTTHMHHQRSPLCRSKQSHKQQSKQKTSPQVVFFVFVFVFW